MRARRRFALLMLVMLLAVACATGLRRASSPPAGLAVGQVPQFAVLGFDDNGISGMPGSGTTGGIRWVVELLDGRSNPAGRGNPRTFDGTPARASFYAATRYLERVEMDHPEHVKAALHAAAAAGHEIGLHTHEHAHGKQFDSAQWSREIDLARSWLVKPFDAERAASAETGAGVEAAAIRGFRSPFLEYGPPLFPALRERGVAYDCSVEVGFTSRYHGGNLPWPYRLPADARNGQPPARPASGASPELWELPVAALIVPPDELATKYGFAPGLRQRMHAKQAYFKVADGKITGFDWNLWVEFQMSAAEFVATVEYSLDQRLAGNRAPLLLGVHSDIYSEQYQGITGSTAEERRAALTTVLDRLLARPQVRVVSAAQLLEWLRNPAAI